MTTTTAVGTTILVTSNARRKFQHEVAYMDGPLHRLGGATLEAPSTIAGFVAQGDAWTHALFVARRIANYRQHRVEVRGGSGKYTVIEPDGEWVAGVWVAAEATS